MSNHIELPGQCTGQPDAYGVRSTIQLNTRCVSSDFFPAAAGSGIILYEPFGGICAGLEMCLRNGLKIVRYYYSDVDALAQHVALHRINQFLQQYPEQLDTSAVVNAVALFAADIRDVSSKQLHAVVTQYPTIPWLIVAGFFLARTFPELAPPKVLPVADLSCCYR